MFIYEFYELNERLPNSQAIEASMLFWAKKKRVGIWGFKGKEDDSQEDGKGERLANKLFSCQEETMDMRGLEQRSIPSTPPADHPYLISQAPHQLTTPT